MQVQVSQVSFANRATTGELDKAREGTGERYNTFIKTLDRRSAEPAS